MLDDQDKKKIGLEFLAAIRRSIRKSPKVLEENKIKSPKVHLNIPEPHSKRYANGFNEIFRRDRN